MPGRQGEGDVLDDKDEKRGKQGLDEHLLPRPLHVDVEREAAEALAVQVGVGVRGHVPRCDSDRGFLESVMVLGSGEQQF